MKKSFSLVLFLIILWGCMEKEYIYEEFKSPTIEFLSTRILSKNTCEIELKINLGVGASFKEAYISLTDITTSDGITTMHNFTLTSEKEQIHRLTIEVDKDYHDYRAKVILVSQKNEYSSNVKMISFSQTFEQSGVNNVELALTSPDLMYVDEERRIGKFMNKGEFFIFTVFYSKIPPLDTKTSIMLNGSIPIECSIEYVGWNTNSSVSGAGYLPNDIPPGVYDIHVYINGVEYILAYRIEIFPGYYKINYIDPGPVGGFTFGHRFGCFQEDKNLIFHIIMGIDPNDKWGYLHELWLYDLETNKWTKKNPIPIPKQNATTNPQIIKSNDKNYILSSSENVVSVWEYDHINDLWSKITDYPGLGTNLHNAFVIDRKLYMGGGSNFQDSYYDFWEYDFTIDNWTPKQNLPPRTTQIEHSPVLLPYMCSGTDKCYLMNSYNELWEYTPQNDHWERITVLKNGPARRSYSNLLYKDGCIFVVGGYTYEGGGSSLTDVWKYDTNKNSWTLLSNYGYTGFHFNWYPIPAFFYKNNIFLGWVSFYHEGKPFFIEFGW